MERRVAVTNQNAASMEKTEASLKDELHQLRLSFEKKEQEAANLESKNSELKFQLASFQSNTQQQLKSFQS